MTEAELAAIEARAGAVKAIPEVHRHAQDEEDWISAIDASSSDVPALVAEVRRLRGVLAVAVGLLESHPQDGDPFPGLKMDDEPGIGSYIFGAKD